MFEAQESTPWYRSLAGLVFASILLPPIGLVLLWTRRGEAMGTKILAMTLPVLFVSWEALLGPSRRHLRAEVVFPA